MCWKRVSWSEHVCEHIDPTRSLKLHSEAQDVNINAVPPGWAVTLASLVVKKHL